MNPSDLWWQTLADGPLLLALFDADGRLLQANAAWRRHISAENFIRLDDKRYEELVHKVAKAKSGPKAKTACREAVEYLMNRFLIIPLGEMYFNILAKPQFQGWDLNELNQLDLTDLREVQ